MNLQGLIFCFCFLFVSPLFANDANDLEEVQQLTVKDEFDKLSLSKDSALIAYRSVGLGTFGMATRFCVMPLEKIAFYMNSSQASGKNQLAQSVQLCFKKGFTSPYRVVGPASFYSWFLQYSVVGAAFQAIDHGLSKLLDTKPVCYGSKIMEAASTDKASLDENLKSGFKALTAPVLASSIESGISNRAEVQRYFGFKKFANLESQLKAKPLQRAIGPAFMSNASRNFIMCQTSFIITPLTYHHFVPQEHKNANSFFWYGLSANILLGNSFAIAQQALWGRSLDYLAKNKKIDYYKVIEEGLKKEGISAFFNSGKWFTRSLMNAPVQGVLPWFYNEVLPLGEGTVLKLLENGSEEQQNGVKFTEKGSSELSNEEISDLIEEFSETPL